MLQTKILEGRTNISECVFEALFKGVSTVFGLLTIEKCFENIVRNVCSDFQKSSFGMGKLMLSSCELDRYIEIISSSCDFDRHIDMLSSSCEFDRQVRIGHVMMLPRTPL